MPKLNIGAKRNLDQIIQTVDNGVGEIFLDAPGKTGKLFLIRLILAVI